MLAFHAMDVQSSSSLAQPNSDIVVLADPQDPYYLLAEEIAKEEGAPLLPDLETALVYEPVSLIWVASPPFFSDEVFVRFGLAMKEHPTVVSTGIITGSFIQSARGFWERRNQVGSETFFAVNAPNMSARIPEGRIFKIAQERVETQPLTKIKFIHALGAADYLTFTGHGGNSWLGLDEETKFDSGDIEHLSSPIIATASCQTVRPWRENSIALRFVDQGVAAYSGFAFSPNEGYLLGEFDELPFRYTWPDFPIGYVIQVQNRGTVQGYAHFPFQYLLGDPRLSLQAKPPYEIASDQQDGSKRIIELRNVPAGVIPIRIRDGAEYSFVHVPGVSSASERDPFYNSRLQMMNLRNDKLILLLHKGGDLTLELQKQAPWYWLPIDILFDSLDHTFLFSQQSSGDILSLVFSIIPLFWVGWHLSKKHFARQQIMPALALGIAASVLQGMYMLARLNHVTITSKDITFSPLSLVAGFTLSACGALIFFRASSRVGRSVALAVMTFSSWAPMLFGLSAVAVINIFSVSQLGSPIYNYSLGLLSLISFAISLILAWLALQFIKPLDE
jgi:hypothetical protein